MKLPFRHIGICVQFCISETCDLFLEYVDCSTVLCMSNNCSMMCLFVIVFSRIFVFTVLRDFIMVLGVDFESGVVIF